MSRTGSPCLPIDCHGFDLSRLKVFITMYRLMLIHPHLNHTIWLLCASVMASLAVPALSLPPNRLLMATSMAGLPFAFVFLPSAPASTTLNMVANISRKVVYFRSTLTVVSVYKSTGEENPGFPAVRAARKRFAPLYSDMWLGWEEIP